METEVSSPCSQEAIIEPYPEPYEYNPKLATLLPQDPF
jgi:hypothetical protein